MGVQILSLPLPAQYNKTHQTDIMLCTELAPCQDMVNSTQLEVHNPRIWEIVHRQARDHKMQFQFLYQIARCLFSFGRMLLLAQEHGIICCKFLKQQIGGLNETVLNVYLASKLKCLSSLPNTVDIHPSKTNRKLTQIIRS